MSRHPLAFALAVALAGCGSTDEFRGARLFYDRDTLAETLEVGEPGMVLGEFPLSDHAVVDGDTLRVEGLDATLRLLAIDTEETFKSEKDWRAYEAGFDAYLEKKRGSSTRPVKAATPLGMEAKAYAEDFFRGVTHIRVERDHPKEIRGRYGRFLAYAFADKGGEWVNYNVECVRAGMSPYFTKYGYSRRFHDQFVAAQEEARAAERGIWDPAKEHFRDYEERLEWWDARAEVVAAFEREAEGRDDWISLTNWDALQRLSDYEGREVVLLGLVGEVRPRKGRAPARVLLSRRMFSDFPLVFFDDDVLAASHAEDATGEFVRVQGTIGRYHFKQKKGQRGPGESQLQMQIKRPDQITFIDTRPGHAPTPAAPPMPAEPPPPVEAEPPPAQPVDDQPPETSDDEGSPDAAPDAAPPDSEAPVPPPPPPA